ncbi:hypothetical protein CF319_g6946 [Tilletia indica]|nr:hypothetical protein CF319_g6946 [Tilletia indica]
MSSYPQAGSSRQNPAASSSRSSQAKYRQYELDDLDEALYATYPPSGVPPPPLPAPETQQTECRVFRTFGRSDLPHPDLQIKAQEHVCRDPIMAEWPQCRACVDIVECERAGAPVPPDLFCSWRNVRGVQQGKRTPEGLFKVPGKDQYFADDRHLPKGTTHSLPSGLPPSPLRRMLDRDSFAAEPMVALLAGGVLPMLTKELEHALAPGGAFGRAGDVDESGTAVGGARCDHCSHFFLGSSQCVDCGKELCHNCMEVVRRASSSQTWQTRESVLSCRPRKGQAGYHQHTPAKFFPVTRFSAEVLAMDVSLAKALSAPFQAHADSWLQGLAFERGITASGFTYAEGKPYRGIKSSGARMVMISPMMTPAAQELLVARALQQKDGPTLLRHFKATALTDNQLTRVMKADTVLPAKFQNKEGQTKMGTVTWAHVCKQLTAAPGDRRFVDVRDFPKDGELEDIAPGLTRAFYVLSLFPQMPTSEADTRQTTLDRQPDLLQWVESSRWRDAQSKIYAATELEAGNRANTALHVDEAGALNTCLWTYQDSPAAVDAIQERSKGSSHAPGPLPFDPSFPIPNPSATQSHPITPENQDSVAKAFRKLRDEVFQNKDDRGEVAAVWTVFPPCARRHMQAAADRLAANQELDEPASGAVLFSQEFDATKAFIDALILEGGKQCTPFIIHQRVCETVVIPPGFPHQVANIRPSLKVARDVLPLSHVSEVLSIQRERSQAAKDGTSPGQDACMLLPTLYNAWRASSAEHLEALAKDGLQPVMEGLNMEVTSRARETQDWRARIDSAVAELQETRATANKTAAEMLKMQQALAAYGAHMNQGLQQLTRSLGL